MATNDSTQPTQPATQQVLDPRRLGRNHSGLNEKDVADVLAVLHPASPGAIKIVEDMAATRRQHVLFRNPYDDSFGEYSDIEEQETIIISPPFEEPTRNSGIGADLALRMSSPLKEPSLGFVFGRNERSSDIVFGSDSGKRISNQHFRIYLNENTILMLEDMSTNGTLVDENLLRGRESGRFAKSRMLNSGSIICIQNANENEVIKFIVRIPSRTSHQHHYHENVRAFLTKCVRGPEQLKAALQRLGKDRSGPPMHWDGGVKYNIIGLLGKGAFATVHQLATKIDGSLLAAKELEKRRFMKNGQLDKKIDNEMKIMEELRHPNVVQFVEYYDQGDFLYIIMEFVRHGDLQGYLNQRGRMPESLVRTMAQQILSALAYLHRRKITHRDIKPDNILIASFEPFSVKLSDFGLSKVVKHDETFLKTFCGTLLYCAPEVFPDFDGRATQGTKRRRGAKQQFHSYSSSVDIWSFAAVLWYALCGKPPFEGIADATGRAMYNNIMTTCLDTTPLREANVSDLCINLLCRMLQTDPALRPTDRECLNHPWLREGVAVAVLEDPTLQSILEEDESENVEEQLSQLNFCEDLLQSDDYGCDVLEDAEFEQLVSDRQSKKIRVDPLVPRNQMRDKNHGASSNPSFQSEHLDDDKDAAESFRIEMKPLDKQRLFGEIGQSALQSSGILSAHANDALSHDDTSSEVLPDTILPDQVAITSNRGLQEQVDTSGHKYLPQSNTTFSSPSLLGAESMVRDLNMISAQSPPSGAHSPDSPATPRTPAASQHNAPSTDVSQHSQVSEATPRAKPPQLDRQISLPKTASFYYDPYDPSTHNLEYASKVSGFDFVGAAAAKVAETKLPDTMRYSTDAGNCSGGDVYHNDHQDSSVIPGLPLDLDIKPPPRRLGKLVATADSFVPGLTLNIERSLTSWGRLPANTIVYENPQDTRVPKTAFGIFWYSTDVGSPSVDTLSQQGKDWTTLNSLYVGISTGATSGISINGKHLRKVDDKGRPLFGHLHNGDIIQVFQDARGVECLKFRCEIYHGIGKDPRAPGESFDIFTKKRDHL
ncbi:kinase-like protein [Aaosphaeria arxii CBS 175.79]|uniref:Kinase-like protein n=1 Tax=Aaosphaeria arxii CBS 175.79 TaxID=1450172 RepID=A0A6A5XA30_9PLEO|nr:kinase-like protein [Aaosphaeria arxii CBS 175.79]KAF2009801.1 kinase-like protein [Aaosphaeria arxii CBS 175.79]